VHTDTHSGPAPRIYIRTFGCQQNVSDSERIAGMLRDIGYEQTGNPEEADVILFNTCAVREHAEDRVFGNVGALKRLKETKPKLVIAVGGCMVHQRHIADRFLRNYPDAQVHGRRDGQRRYVCQRVRTVIPDS